MYKFYIDAGDGEVQVWPRYDDKVNFVHRVEPDQMFWRRRLNGKLTLLQDDYDLINDAAFDTIFEIRIEDISGAEDDWNGKFNKTMCEFDADFKILAVTPEPVDDYTAIMENINKKFNLIDLAPERVTVNYVKQPMFQFYQPGAGYVSNVINGQYFEAEVFTPESNTTTLENDYKFALAFEGLFLQGAREGVPPVSAMWAVGGGGFVDLNSEYYIQIIAVNEYGLYRVSDDALLYVANGSVTDIANGVTNFVSEDDVTTQLRFYPVQVYARGLTDVGTLSGVSPFPTDDLTSEGGYEFVRPLTEVSIYLSDQANAAPTRYTKFADDSFLYDGLYFEYPDDFTGTLYPVTRRDWEYFSIWFYFDVDEVALQAAGSKQFVLQDAYRLSSVIETMFQAINPLFSHTETAGASEFLYTGTNPIRGDLKIPAITPKSNVIVGEYDQADDVEDIRLRDLLDMLRIVYRCYFHIGAKGLIKIEHAEWYRNGGSYTTPIDQIDLTTLIEPKTQKNWSHLSNSFKYERQDLPQRIEFEWMDNVGDAFTGYPIELVSNYVEFGNIKTENVSLFTTDLDFIIAAPDKVSRQGFVLFECNEDGDELDVPFVSIQIGNNIDYNLQNGWLSWIFIHENYYLHDMPCETLIINENQKTAESILRTKLQDIEFPDFVLHQFKLITTQMGSGQIKEGQKNLSGRGIKLQLRHDIE
jgi:hypothetical protein